MNLQDVCFEKLRKEGLVDPKKEEQEGLYRKMVYDIVGTYIQEKMIREINNYCNECDKSLPRNERKYFSNTINSDICRDITITQYNRVKKSVIKTLNEECK